MSKASRNMRRLLAVGLAVVMVAGMLPGLRLEVAAAEVTYLVTATPPQGGTVTVNGIDGGGVFQCGQTLTMQALLNLGWVFQGWYKNWVLFQQMHNGTGP